MESDKKPVGRFDKSKGNVVTREHIEKVINGTAKVRKKSELSKMKDAFIAGNAAEVKNHIFSDVIIPEIKRLLLSIIKDGADMIFNGHVSGKGRGDRFSSDYVSYDRYSSRGATRRAPESYETRRRFNSDDISFETYGEAKSVLDRMYECVRTYGHVTVGAMYDMADITAPYTAENYGWIDLRNASIERVYDGYVIKLPRAMPIDR